MLLSCRCASARGVLLEENPPCISASLEKNQPGTGAEQKRDPLFVGRWRFEAKNTAFQVHFSAFKVHFFSRILLVGRGFQTPNCNSPKRICKKKEIAPEWDRGSPNSILLVFRWGKLNHAMEFQGLLHARTPSTPFLRGQNGFPFRFLNYTLRRHSHCLCPDAEAQTRNGSGDRSRSGFLVPLDQGTPSWFGLLGVEPPNHQGLLWIGLGSYQRATKRALESNISREGSQDQAKGNKR